MKAQAVIGPLAAGAVGVLLGYLLPSGAAPPEANDGGVAAAPPAGGGAGGDDDLLQSLQANIVELAEENRRLKAQLAAGGGATSEGGGGGGETDGEAEVFAVPKEYLKKVRVQPLDDSYKLSSDLVQFLQVKPGEREQIESTLESIKREIQRHETDNLELVSENGNRTTYRIPAFPDMGARIKDDFTRQVAATLGPERSEILLDKLAESRYNNFYDFGQREREITLTVQQQGNGLRYYIRDTFKLGNSKHTYNRAASKIPESFSHLFQLEDQ